jgi:hypothetical protein
MKTPVGYSCIMIVLALCLSEHLAAQNTSPCNQGRAEDFGEVDPRHVNAICIPESGRMAGLVDSCSIPLSGEQFGRQIVPLGDISGDGLADFLVARIRCDTVIPGYNNYPYEILLYKGVRGGVPASKNGERIGSNEIASRTSYVAHGDFDADGIVDLAVRIQLMPDTSSGNVDNNYDISSLVVFWGSSGGHYSVQDTTHLACEGQAWMDILQSCSVDIDNDGVSDLCVFNGYGFSNGRPVRIPYMHIFRGQRTKRWGRNDVENTANWVWWNSLLGDRIVVIDQDGDGALDFGFHTNVSAGTGTVAVLYGRRGMMPDTAAAQSVDLSVANGHVSQFLDISGDGVPELIVTSGSENTIKVFIGLKGQRLQEQYGTGIDPPNPDSAHWWGKPWCQLWLPKKINANWFYDYYRLFDLGDANHDGYNDIYTISWPYLLCYTGGKYMDSLVDALVDIRPWGNIASGVVLGDIDGSGEQTMAIGNDGVRFLKPSRAIPSQWNQERRFPQQTLAHIDDTTREENGNIWHLHALPNPAGGEVTIEWQGKQQSGTARITISDAGGRSVANFEVETASSSARWRPDHAPAGIYYITIRTSVSSATTQVVLQ